mgnify:CR=1 FL=1
MQQRKSWTVQDTKLIPPARPGGLIERRSLLDAAIAGAGGRLLLVVDIVLADLLLGIQPGVEITVHQLIADHRYPNPSDSRVRWEYYSDE